eukprot:PhM_4_TR8221/c0_g1_i1/m.5852
MRHIGTAGVLFQAFGPAVVVAVLCLRKSPQLSLIAVAGCFLYVLSLLLSSVWYYVVPPMNSSGPWNSVWGVCFHMVARVGFFLLYIKVERGFTSQGEVLYASDFNALPVGLAVGYGYGLAQVCLSFGMLVNNAFNVSKPYATMYDLERCDSLSFLFWQSYTGMFMTLLHPMWMGVMYVALTGITDKGTTEVYTPLSDVQQPARAESRLFPRNRLDRRTCWTLLAVSEASHMLASLSTTIPSCKASLSLLCVISIGMMGVLWFSAKAAYMPFSPIPQPKPSANNNGNNDQARENQGTASVSNANTTTATTSENADAVGGGNAPATNEDE